MRPGWLAWAGVALGAWTILNGVGHDVGVWNVARAEDRPYDLRYASLLALGVTLAFAGGLTAWSALSLGRGERWAPGLAAAASLLVVAHVLIFAPILPAWGLLALHVAWLCALAWRARARAGRGRTAPA